MVHFRTAALHPFVDFRQRGAERAELGSQAQEGDVGGEPLGAKGVEGGDGFGEDVEDLDG